MNLNPSRLICLALLLVLSVAATGCAKRMAAAKDVNQIEAAGIALIQSVKAKDDGSQVEISTDKPLTYTSYKTSEPPKVYIDLAQTELGATKSPIEVGKGNIKTITLIKQDFGGGFLSRVEISLDKDTEFSVITDPADHGKLLVMFKQPVAGNPASTPSDAKNPVELKNTEGPIGDNSITTPVGTTNVTSKPEAVKDQSPIQQPVAESSKEATVTNQTIEPEGASAAEKRDVPEGTVTPEIKGEVLKRSKIVTSVDVVADGVEIVGAEINDNYKSFVINKPDRLIVDLFGAKNSLPLNFVDIKRFGIIKARIGVSPEKVRIVFDAAGEKLPTYEVSKIEKGLKVTFIEPLLEQAVTNTHPPETAKPTSTVKAASGRPEKGLVESIDFKLVDGRSRVEIKFSGTCIPAKPVKSAKGLSLLIKNCQVPKNLQRTMDTREFASTVQSITPYQVKVAGGTDTRILVKLKGNQPYTFKEDGNSLLLDITNPQPAETKVVEPVEAKVNSTPLAPKIEEELMSTPSVKEQENVAELPKSIVAKPVDKKKYTGRKVTLEFSDADVRKIFQLIAEVSNLNFLIADDVTGTISIKLVNVPWDQALDVILDTKSLGMQREGNIVQIKPKSKMQSLADEELAAKKARERGMELRTEIFDINYAAVADIVTQFNSLKSDRGVITSDARTNRVIVKDIATAIDDMKFLLRNLDSPEKQVMIEARIVEAQTSFVRDLGVQWGIHYADGTASLAGISTLDTGFGGIVTAPPSSGTAGPGASVGMSFGKLASNIQLDMRLSAAVTADQIKIMSTPRVVTLNNKAAKISQGASIPYQTTSAEGTKTEFVEAALTLEVTPHITADGSISMKIKASNNSAGAGSPPPINKKEATTELLVKNGETTVIGGIYVDSETESDKGVPFLQDIPLLGWLFKSNSKNKTKNELLIFITPKIVS